MSISLKDEERDALQAIDCDSDQDHDMPKSLALMGFIYVIIGYFIMRG